MLDVARQLVKCLSYVGWLIVVLLPLSLIGLLVIFIAANYGLRSFWGMLTILSSAWFFVLLGLGQRSPSLRLSDAHKLSLLNYSVYSGSAAVLCAATVYRLQSDELTDGNVLAFSLIATGAFIFASLSGILIGHLSRIWTLDR